MVKEVREVLGGLSHAFIHLGDIQLVAKICCLLSQFERKRQTKYFLKRKKKRSNQWSSQLDSKVDLGSA